LSFGSQPANISLIIVEAARPGPLQKKKEEPKAKNPLTPVIPYQLGSISQ
jgi:hypothetical protein